MSVLRLPIKNDVLRRFIEACEERGSDPSRQATLMLLMWIERIGYSEARQRYERVQG